MPKQRYNDIDKECPICGGIIWGKGQKVLIEEAKITVCQSCAQHGTIIHEKAKPSIAKRSSMKKPKNILKKPFSQKSFNRESSIVVVSDYAKRIRGARSTSNLTQKQFARKIHEKESLIRRIETGKVEPTLELSKKIEKTYNIKLLQKADESLGDYKNYLKKDSDSSLGDIAFIKKKK